MPDAIKALLLLQSAPREKLTRQIYNVGAFNPSAGEALAFIKKAFPAANVSFAPDMKRQAIVDSWPEDVDDATARADWNWSPDFGMERAFNEYLIPAVRERYAKK